MDNSPIVITHQKKGDGLDFNLRGVPYELMLSLIGALKWEHQKQSSLLAAPDFKRERALQHERHIQQCAKTGDDPKQIFMDFPIY
jgi:hypothetical protein